VRKGKQLPNDDLPHVDRIVRQGVRGESMFRKLFTSIVAGVIDRDFRLCTCRDFDLPSGGYASFDIKD